MLLSDLLRFEVNWSSDPEYLTLLCSRDYLAYLSDSV